VYILNHVFDLVAVTLNDLRRSWNLAAFGGNRRRLPVYWLSWLLDSLLGYR